MHACIQQVYVIYTSTNNTQKPDKSLRDRLTLQELARLQESDSTPTPKRRCLRERRVRNRVHSVYTYVGNFWGSNTFTYVFLFRGLVETCENMYVNTHVGMVYTIAMTYSPPQAQGSGSQRPHQSLIPTQESTLGQVRYTESFVAIIIYNWARGEGIQRSVLYYT